MNLKGVPVLVTGGSGFVGSRIAAWLAAQGADVRAVVRRRGAHPGLESPNIRQAEGDFTDPLMARYACGGRDLVFHAAATIGKDLSEAMHVNVTGTAVLAGAARAAGCQRFLHISTLSVYDFQSGREEFNEDAPLRVMGKSYAHSPAATPHYGITKAEAERALQLEMADGLPATIFRLGAVLGVHPTSSWAIKVPAKVKAGKVAVLGDGSDIMPWTHVDNVTHAIGLALDRPESIGRAYNVADGEVAWRDFIEDMRSWFPGAPPAPVISPDERNAGAKFIGHCPNDRLKTELGYTPIRTYFEGMAEAGSWWKKSVKR